MALSYEEIMNKQYVAGKDVHMSDTTAFQRWANTDIIPNGVSSSRAKDYVAFVRDALNMLSRNELDLNSAKSFVSKAFPSWPKNG